MSSIQVLIVLFIVICGRCAFLPVNKTIKGEFIIYWILLIIIVTFRPDTLPDYENYMYSFYYENERYEPLFRIIYLFFQSITSSHLFLFFTVALFTVSFKILAIQKMSVLPVLSIPVWISYILLFQDMIAIRAALAASIGLWIIYFKCNDKLGWTIICIVAAVLSHYSALILIVIPFLSVTKNRKWLYLSVLLITAIIAATGFSFTNLLSFTGVEEYDKLMNSYMYKDSTSPFKPQQLLRLGICVSAWIFIDRININKYVILLLKTYTIGCVVFFLFWGIAGVAIRLSELFIVTEILVIPLLALILGKGNIRITKFLPIGISCIVFGMELIMFSLI